MLVGFLSSGRLVCFVILATVMILSTFQKSTQITQSAFQLPYSEWSNLYQQTGAKQQQQQHDKNNTNSNDESPPTRYFSTHNNTADKLAPTNNNKGKDTPIINSSHALSPNRSESLSRNGGTYTNETTTVSTTTTTTSPSPSTETVILSFVSKDFIKYIDFWYTRLTALGYKEHHVAAWDNETLQFSQQSGYRTIPCVTHGYKGSVPTGKNQLFRRYLFAARWRCVQQQLQQQRNVLLTDVDNTFQRYVPLSNFERWNVIHAYGGGYPIRHYKAHGFTVCGGMTWLSAHPATLHYVQLITDQCGNRCDDQGVVNSLFGKLNVDWRVQRPLTPSVPAQHNWMEPAGEREGWARLTNHSVRIWDANFAFRGPLEAQPCPSRPWVAMPINAKGTGAKTHTLWQQHCPPTNSNGTVALTTDAKR